jgi:hypothetical protein
VNVCILRTACALTIVLAWLCACSGSATAPVPSGLAGSHMRPLIVTAADVKRVVAWGPKGQVAVAQCPQGDKVVAGGSSSSDGSFVGAGYANSGNTAWIVKPSRSGASAEAFASCVSRNTAGLSFRWRLAFPRNDLASAQCRVGYVLVTGYGTGTVKESWFDSATNTFWVNGGGTAHASCVRSDAGVLVRHAWNKSQKPKIVFAGCGKGYTVLGGSMGDSAWPGPPIQEHPGDASGPAAHGYDGWWTFSNANNELTWAACVRSS